MAVKGGSGSIEGQEPEAWVTYHRPYEVAKCNSENDMWIVIHGRVYDLTHFFSEHPDGEEVPIELTGWDATESFEVVGHSSDAKEMLKQYYVGELHPIDRKGFGSENSSSMYKSCWPSWIIPVVGAALLAIMDHFYMAESKLS
ncbi:cytochrome b5 type B-like [Trichosurus vulpecula]|uniref:cytochrome b5 type B-like n=1 Tax=Trichosurus vulpecula TaxID=9337 RepID=UPI00186B4FD8|nr:cytochrome b5 type B-like [Trichosurus vulpecula]